MIRHVVVGSLTAKLVLEGQHIEFAREDGQTIAGDFSCLEVSPGVYSVLLNGNAHRVTLTGRGALADGRRVEIEVFDPRDRRAASKSAGTHGARQVLAPMPGKIIRLLIAAGDEVSEGQGLVVVEAMKMQNEMKSPKTGRVAEVRVQAEATVAAGQILLVIE